MLWEVDIYPAEGQPDLLARRVAGDAADLGLHDKLPVAAARGYLLQGKLNAEQVARLARELLSDPIVERTVVAPAGDASLSAPPNGQARLVYVLPKPGVPPDEPTCGSVVSAQAQNQLSQCSTRRLAWSMSGVPPSRS